MLIQNGLLTCPTGNMTSFSLWVLFFLLPVQRCWMWFPVLCLNDYTLKCSATMITSSAQGIRNCNDCHSEVDSFRIFLNMSLCGQNMVSESLQEHQSQKRRFIQRTINGPIYPVFWYKPLPQCLFPLFNGANLSHHTLRGTSLSKSTVVKGKFKLVQHIPLNDRKKSLCVSL